METNDSPLFSSATGEWGTPSWLFEELNREFNFTLDPCASDSNHKVDKYYTIETNGLLQDWRGEVVFMNPPYGREIVAWVEKASLESKKKNTIVVGLLPARTDTRWFHDFIYKQTEIRFLKGRIKFIEESGEESKNSAPFPSMIVIWR